MKDKKKLIILILILLLIGLGIFFSIKYFNKEKNTNTTTTEEQEDYTVYEDEQEDEIEHNLKLTIIGPEEDIIEPRQARMYNALIEGNGKYSNQVKCHWEFYLNENNEEVLYKTMDNTGIISGQSKELCGFTSTFIDRVGVLRVVLTMTVFDYTNENIETISAERIFTVK